jgi:hypothetical protein
MQRLSAAIALVLVVITAGSAHAAGPTDRGALVLAGSRSASITVRVDAAIADLNPFHIDAATNGSYAGYLISDTKGHVLLGSILVRGVGLAAGEGIPLGFTRGPLKPGRYVLTLLTDGKATVTIPLAGAVRVAVRPMHPVSVFENVVRNDLAPSTPAGSPLAYSSTPVPAGHHVLASLTEFDSGTAELAGEADQCFTTSPLCQLGGDGGSSNYLAPGIGESSGYSGVSMSPANFDASTSALLDSADLGAQARHAGFVLVVG